MKKMPEEVKQKFVCWILKIVAVGGVAVAFVDEIVVVAVE